MGYLEERDELNDRVKWGEVRVVELDPSGSLQQGWMAVVIRHSSGVVYVNQSGGVACQQRVVEGYLVMLGNTPFRADEPPTKSDKLNAVFHDGDACKWEWTGAAVPEDRIRWLRKLVRQIACWSFEGGLGRLELDLARKNEIAEAWIPVITPDGPGVLVYRNCD